MSVTSSDNTSNDSTQGATSDERHIHTVVQGSGPTIICLHGLSGSSLNWNRLSRSLKSNFKTVAFDFIGHAKSSAPQQPNHYQIQAVLDDIDQQIDKHSSGPAILCGLSMGAAAMLMYTLNNPEKVKALILTSFPPGKQALEVEQEASDSTPPPFSISSIATEFADAILEEGLEKAGERFVWGSESPFSERDGQLIKQGFAMHKHPHGLAHCMKEFLAKIPCQSDLLEQVKSLNIPTLIIAGSKDTPSLKYSQRLTESLPKESHQLIVIENGGHLVNIDSYQRYNHAVSDFLQQIDR